jgi:hypothetical protein
MSYTGTIKVTGTVKDNVLQTVKISSLSELHVEDKTVGKTAEEAIAFFSSVFSLCPASQVLCARLALTGKPPLPKDIEALRLEWLFESLRYFVLDLGSPEYRTAGLPILAGIRDDQNKLLGGNIEENTAKEILQHLLGEARKLLRMNLSEQWPLDVLYDVYCDNPASVREVFNRLSDIYVPQDPFGFGALMPDKGIEDRSLKEILQDLHGKDLTVPPAIGLTGAIARLRNSDISSIQGQWGNCSLVRVAARLQETLDLIDNWDHTDCEFAFTEPDSSGLRLAAVQNARGILIHAVRCDSEGKITFYRILTPTEINFNTGALQESSVGLEGDSHEEFMEDLRLVCLSFDPCTQIQTEIVDA